MHFSLTNNISALVKNWYLEAVNTDLMISNISVRFPSRIYLSGLALSLLLILQGCNTALKVGADVREIRPGVLEGYLALQELPNSLLLLPPPPEEGSAAFAADLEISEKTISKGDSVRWEEASRDAILYFPEALESFAGVLDVPVSREQTPHLYLLMRRVMTDASLSTYVAKKHYNRLRPFMVNNQPTCSPGDEEYLMKDGSYPSGHTAIGWAWALVLCELFPENSNLILDRGRAFGESRIVCNVHWYSDVIAGRLMGAATVARLHADPEFIADLNASKKEIEKLRRKNK
jgi:acid phosphatase (class A)